MARMHKGVYKEWQKPEKLEQLKQWKHEGLEDRQIAHNIGISSETLKTWKRKYSDIREAINGGKMQANLIVENVLFEKAKKGNLTAIIFWLKNNWRDKYNDSKLSKEERDLAIANKGLTKAKAKKIMAEAGITEAHLKELTELDSLHTSVKIVNDLDNKPDKIPTKNATNSSRDRAKTTSSDKKDVKKDEDGKT